MKRHVITLVTIALLAAGAGYYHAHHQTTDTTVAIVHSATRAVDRLYRNENHSLPATNLDAAKIAHAKKILQQVPQKRLTATQRDQVAQANSELDDATQMLTVTAATQAPIAATTTYQHSAQKALAAYHQLQQRKPVFTQVYQQPVNELDDAKTAAEAVTTLQTAKAVTPSAIATTEAAVARVTPPADSDFPETASSVVNSAKQKLTTLDQHRESSTPPAASASAASAEVPQAASTSGQPAAATASGETSTTATSNSSSTS